MDNNCGKDSDLGETAYEVGQKATILFFNSLALKILPSLLVAMRVRVGIYIYIYILFFIPRKH